MKFFSNTEPTPLSILKAVGELPAKVQNKVAELPCVMVVGFTVRLEITGAKGLGFTVTVTDLVTTLEPFEAVMVYIVVSVGFTEIFVLPKTEPTPLSMVKDVAAPPEIDQNKVLELPFVILAGEAKKLIIDGGLTVVMVTVTVTDLVAVPLLFVAVSV